MIFDKLNKEQKEAVDKPLNWCTKIVAGAGTGKTEIISRRFTKLTLDLIDLKVKKPANKILVITFTDKAATNMKDRIINSLKKFDIDVINSDMWISTFHSFCSKVLKKHSLEVNLSPQCDLADEQSQKTIYDNIIKKLIYNEAQYIKNVDEITSQLKLDINLLSIHSIQEINKIGDPERVFDSIYYVIKKIKSLGLTPSEFLDRSIQSTQAFSDILKSIPFGFSDKEGYQNGWELHLNPYIEDSSNMNDTTFGSICTSKVILNKNGSSKAPQWSYATGFPENIDPINDLELYLTRLITLIYALYQNHLMTEDLIDYDDQINYTINILKNNPSLRKHYQNQFKHIIIDEFQDTSGSQLELVKLLLNPEEPNITFVGDRKQSIYSFRYAQMENLEVLHQYLQTMHKKEYKEVQLKTNYRSTPHVLEPVNVITKDHLILEEKLEPNPHKEFDMENKNVQLTRILFDSKIKEARVHEAKYIAQEIIKIKTNDKSVNYKDFAVLVPVHSRAELIEQYLKGAGIPAIKKQDNNYFKEPIVKNLMALINLVANPRDEISFIRVLEIQLNQHKLYITKKAIYELIPDDDSFRYSTNFVDKIVYLKENQLLDKLNVPDHIKTYIETVIETITGISSQAQDLSLTQAFYTLTNNISAYANLPDIDVYKAKGYIKIFEKLLIDYTQSDDNTGLKGFTEALKTYQEDKNFELPSISTSDIDAVQLTTVHASKGLEFPYVFVVSLKDGSRPSSNILNFDLQYGNKPGFGIIANKYKGNNTPKKAIYIDIWEKPRELNEKIRLFYVAISRAEKYLNIINLIDPAKNKNVPEYTSDIICQDQIVEVEPSDINYVKCPIENSIPRVKPVFNLSTESIQEHKTNIDTIKLSFSKLSAFNRCPEFYFLKYMSHFPEDKKENKATNIGTIIHNLIYNSIIRATKFTEEEIKSIISQEVLDNVGLKPILGLYNNYLASPYAPDKLADKTIRAEKKFVFTEKIDNIDIDFNGDIDLIIQNGNNRFKVVDFKTNKDITKSLDAYYEQLLIYKKAIESQGTAVERVAILNITEEGYKEITPTIDELLQAEKSYYKSLNSIINYHKSLQLPLNSNDKDCHRCGYKYLCK